MIENLIDTILKQEKQAEYDEVNSFIVCLLRKQSIRWNLSVSHYANVIT